MNTANAPSRSPASSLSLRQKMRDHPLFCYFLMAYAFSWLVWIPYVLSVWDFIPANQFSSSTFPIGTFLGPTLAAFLMTGLTEGDAGLGRLLRRFALWRVGVQWYLFILLGIPACVALGILVLPGAAAAFQPPPPHFVVDYLEGFFVIFFLGGPLAEEPGWRGFALPRLQPRYGPLWGTLILGTLWACWHLPHFLTPAQHGGPGTSPATFLLNFPIFTLMAIALAVIFTWVFNHTRGSLFIAILLHASVDATSLLVPLFPVAIVTSSDLLALIGFGVPALILVILTGGRLGYQPGQEQRWWQQEAEVPAA